jgi:hypothetical protein
MKQSAGALFRTAWALIKIRVVRSGTSVRIAWTLPASLVCLGNPEKTRHVAVVVVSNASRHHWLHFRESSPRT